MTSTLAPHPTPMLGEEVTIGPAIRKLGPEVHVVRDVRSDGYFQVSPREAFVMARLDGTQTFGQIEDAYQERFGKALGDSSWQQLLGLLYARRLLTQPGEDTRAAAAAYEKLRWQNQAARARPSSLWKVRRPLLDPGPVIGWLKQATPWLMHPVTTAIATILVLAMLVTVAFQWPSVWDGYVASWREHPLAVAFGVAGVLVSLVVHEFAHAVTCVWFGGRCREMGVSWRFPLITVYTKMEDIYLVPKRWQRVAVALSGVLAGLVALLPAFVVWLVVADSNPVSDACVVVLVLGSMSSLVNLAPVLGLDGQKAVSHALGVWDVAAESRAWWAGRLRGQAEESQLTGASVWVVPVYGVVVVVLLTVMTLWTLWVGWHLISSGEVPW